MTPPPRITFGVKRACSPWQEEAQPATKAQVPGRAAFAGFICVPTAGEAVEVASFIAASVIAVDSNVHLLTPMSSSFTLPGELPTTMAERHGSNAAVVIVALIAALAMSSVLAVALYYLHILHKSRPRPRKAYDSNMSGLSQDFHKSATQYMLPAMHVSSSCQAQVFTYKQMHLATSNFNPANLILQSASHSVYRGVLPNGRVSAIKQLNDRGKHVDREFRIEVDLLSRLNSPYLLELIGYCADQNHRLLAYEFMPNGSLNEYLHSQGHSESRYNMLDWSTRMRIALDAARGLEYLHEFVSPPVIHRDFKSSIVLLGPNFSAKISEFGSAKLGSDKANGQVFTRVLGTHGYVAPEYALKGELTTKSDVYSFGIVLLELISGCTPVDMERPAEQRDLVSWALPRLTDRDKVHEIVDPMLKGQYAFKELVQVAAIAAMCVQQEADYRPLMTDVVQSLVPLVKQRSLDLLPCSACHQYLHSGSLRVK
ncbi:hypothetical protein GOP47_0000547 [Adiantum capillus-veneris]|uniref:Protein kinase domain-containing protein n=1 Tax=Adiantum capillus-veneris TaxID=13818 RepID=A0A9D4VF65_ADICA|nr:hypothetical protein GOP47_0000547 [Adiantum capillus-veneris]